MQHKVPIKLLSPVVTEEWRIICPCCSWGHWTLIAFPRLSSLTANSSHQQNRSLHPTRVWVQSNCNVHANWPQSASYFWMPAPLMWWVGKTSRSEASLFLSDNESGKIVSQCSQEWNHIMGLQGHCIHNEWKHESQHHLKISSAQLPVIATNIFRVILIILSKAL